MTDVLAFSVFGVEWRFIKLFIVICLAFGGAYALSGVGLVVLYRATGVLNLAFGAIGAAGALIAYWLINHTAAPSGSRSRSASRSAGSSTSLYGMVFGPAFARRDPLVKMMGTLGLALILLGIMAWMAPVGGAFARFLPLPSTQHRYEILDTSVNLTQIISLGSRDRDHGGRQCLPARDEARHRDAGTRERPRDHRDARRPGASRRGRRLVRLGPRLRRRGPHPPRPAHLARLLGLDVPRHLVARGGAHRPAAIALGDAVRRPCGRASRSPSSARTPRCPPTAPPRRSCSRSPRCCTSRGGASSRSRGRRHSGQLPQPARAPRRRAQRRRSTANDRPRRRRAVCSPSRSRPAGDRGRGLDQDVHSVAIYSVVAWARDPLRPRRDDLAGPDRAARRWAAGRRSARLRDLLPFPLLLLATGGITCAIGVLVGLPALRLSGLYLALITLMLPARRTSSCRRSTSRTAAAASRDGR